MGLTPNSEEAVVQTVNWTVLEAPARTKLSGELFVTLQRREAYVGDLGDLDPELQQFVESLVEQTNFTVVTIPIFKHKCKILLLFLFEN